ncbi:DUF533 domain-containing protein [Marinovum sp. KMM 9989]
MSTLAKVAMGYAAARGVDHMSKNQGLGGMLGGAQVPSREAKTGQNPAVEAMDQMPGMDQIKGMMGQAQESGAQGMSQMQDMFTKMMSSAGGAGVNIQEMMGGLMGGTKSEGGGLLSGAGGAGLAGLLSMAGGAAAASGKGVGSMLDQFSGKAPPEAEEAAGLMLRAMIQAAKSDGGIDAEEKAKILETMGEDADADSIAYVKKQLSAKLDPAALARDTPDAQKMQVYSMSLMSIRVDTQAEAQYLDQLAAELGLDQQTVNMLHMQMGVQPLYA